MDDLPRKLEYLVDNIGQPDGRGRYTNDAICRALAELDISATPAYLSLLRKGQRSNPSARLINGLAQVFGVPMEYFFDNPDQEKAINTQIEGLKKLREAHLQGLMLRSKDGLDRASLLELAALLSRVQQTGEPGDS